MANQYQVANIGEQSNSEHTQKLPAPSGQTEASRMGFGLLCVLTTSLTTSLADEAVIATTGFTQYWPSPCTGSAT